MLSLFGCAEMASTKLVPNPAPIKDITFAATLGNAATLVNLPREQELAILRAMSTRIPAIFIHNNLPTPDVGYTISCNQQQPKIN